MDTKQRRKRVSSESTVPKLTPEEQILAAKWLTTSNLGQPEPEEPTREAIERAYNRCVDVFAAEGIEITEEYNMWLKDARRQDEFVRKQWADFKREENTLDEAEQARN